MLELCFVMQQRNIYAQLFYWKAENKKKKKKNLFAFTDAMVKLRIFCN
jgi:hypothetical protein